MHKFVKHTSGRIAVFSVFVYLSPILKDKRRYTVKIGRLFAVEKFIFLGIYIM